MTPMGRQNCTNEYSTGDELGLNDNTTAELSLPMNTQSITVAYINTQPSTASDLHVSIAPVPESALVTTLRTYGLPILLSMLALLVALSFYNQSKQEYLYIENERDEIEDV